MGWTPSALCRHHSARADDSYGMGSQRPQRKESKMNATTAAIDLAKNVFQVALADGNHRVLEQHRLTRAQFERFFDNRKVARIVMEACGSAHHWARGFTARGIEVMLLPAHYVRAYVRRSKTDAADALALLEAARCADIVAVKVKSVEQQSLQPLHRTRSLWMGTRTSRINALHGFCRELGLHVPVGARTGLEAMGRAVADDQCVIPALLRPLMQQLLDEIRVLETRVAQLERQLALVPRESAAWLLVRGLTQGELIGGHASPRAHLQDGRPVLAHAAHPRGGLGNPGRLSGKAQGARAQRRASLGAAAASPIQSQQGRLRHGQQNGALLLRGAARPH